MSRAILLLVMTGGAAAAPNEKVAAIHEMAAMVMAPGASFKNLVTMKVKLGVTALHVASSGQVPHDVRVNDRGAGGGWRIRISARFEWAYAAAPCCEGEPPCSRLHAGGCRRVPRGEDG